MGCWIISGLEITCWITEIVEIDCFELMSHIVDKISLDFGYGILAKNDIKCINNKENDKY